MNKYIKLIFASLIIVGFASCLKDENFDNNISGHNLSNVPKVIELGFINDPNHTRTIGLAFEDKEVTAIAVYVRLAANEVAQEDITVTIDTTGTYAKLSALGVTTLPASFFTYSTPSLKIVIPKGQREASITITTNAIRFDPSTTYGLYFRIVSVDKPGYNISQNYGEFITLFGAKNKYDGVYNLVFRLRASDRPSFNTSTSMPWGGPVHLITVASATVDLFDDWGFGTYIQPLRTATGGYSGFGSTHPRFTFDPTTNKMISAVNAITAPANGRAFQIDPAIESRWDPATGNVYAHFIMTQPGFQPLYIADTFLYVGPR